MLALELKNSKLVNLESMSSRSRTFEFINS